ncbi:hypothetical protein [Massilia sp. LjRoot122]|uniref:hypothetical protein n=1 Tax=Massilia sp. LjRoot122 TaxID=3342257 RepID=UPI003ECC7312
MTQAPQYPIRDVRRMLMVLGAIDLLKPATLVRISELTGLDKKSVTSLISRAQEQTGVAIEKTGAVYAVADWGPVLKRAGCRLALEGEIGTH